MSLQLSTLRAAIERAFAGLAAATIIALISAGTFAMCAPGVALV